MMSYNKFFAALALLSMPFLASCSTAMEGATQQVSFKTVGAEDAYCTVQIGTNDYRYNVHPPQSIWIQKSRKPLFVACNAPGNRVQNVTVESQVASSTYLNGLNAGLGAGWDAESGAMYKYPEEVVVDFTGISATESALPAYMNRDALDPKTQGIEDFGPETLKLPDDDATAARYKAAYAEQEREAAEKAAKEASDAAEKAAFEAEKEKRIGSLEGGFYGDKGVTPDTPIPATKGGKYTPPKTSPAELKDDVVPSSPVSVAPLSEAVPKTVAPAASAAPTPLVPADKVGVVIPSAPSLGKPIFPSSTSF